MNILPTLPAQPGNPSDAAKKLTAATTPGGGARGDDDGGFAAALGDARARADRGDAAGAEAPGAADEHIAAGAPDSAADAATPADLPAAPDLAQFLPGWPPATPVPAPGQPAAPLTVIEAAPPGLPAGAALASAASEASAAALQAAGGAAPLTEGVDVAPAEAPEAGAAPAAATKAERMPPSARGPTPAAGLDATRTAMLAALASDASQRTPAAADGGAGTPAAARAADAASGAAAWAALPNWAAREAGRADGATAALAAPFEAHLAAALDSPAFAPALASQVKWLLREGVQHAQLSLNPADMGPLTVHIALDGTQARVDFSAEFAATRSSIESSLPTLAAALHASGLTLAGGGVFDGQPRHGPRAARDSAAGRARADTTAPALAGTADAGRAARGPRGLVDLVA